MVIIFALLLFFMIVGISARSFNNRTRLFLVVGIVGLLLYLYLT
jgi:hypothetical protein